MGPGPGQSRQVVEVHQLTLAVILALRGCTPYLQYLITCHHPAGVYIVFKPLLPCRDLSIYYPWLAWIHYEERLALLVGISGQAA